MLLGSVYVLISCLVWGLIFVVPLFMGDFSPIEISLGRYFFYGLISWFVIACKGFKPLRNLNWKIAKKAIIFSLMVNIFYYVMLVLSLRYSDPAVVTLILGLTPISVAFYGNWRQPQYRLSSLIWPSVVIGIGLFLVNINAFEWQGTDNLLIYIMGIVSAFVALGVWTWFVESNAKFLKENPDLPASDWTTLVGASTLLWVILLGGLTAFYTGPSAFADKFFVWSDELQSFLIGCLVLGVVCAWIGHLFWNFASSRLHMSMAGQLMIFETIFGLIYVFLVEDRLPQAWELSGMILMLLGVTASLMLLKTPSTQEVPTTD